MKKIIEKVALGLILSGGISILGGSVYDTFQTKEEITIGAKKRNMSVYKLAKEKGRTDVIDMQMTTFFDPYGEYHLKNK